MTVYFNKSNDCVEISGIFVANEMAIDVTIIVQICTEKIAYLRICGYSLQPLPELTYCIGSQSVTYHTAEVTYPPLLQPKLVLDLATRDRCKAELTL